MVFKILHYIQDDTNTLDLRYCRWNTYFMDYSTIIELAGKTIDLLGIAVIIFGTIFSVVKFAFLSIGASNIEVPYQALRQSLGRTIIIGLEILIAGDIVRSIAVPPSFTTVGVLAIIVLIRAFLSMQIEHETEWKLPWQKKEK